jgi:hypothetical protein
MKRMVPPDRTVVETQIGSRLYTMGKDGTVRVNDADAKALKAAGYTQANAGGFAKALGWICQDCYFHGYFKVCGKCGSEKMKRPNE